MIVFSDITNDYDWEKPDHKLTDLRNRTDLIRNDMSMISSTSNLRADLIIDLDKKLNIIDTKIEDLHHIVGALLLKETSVITEEELKIIYKMFTSVDKENKVVAVEAILNKLKEI